MHEGQVRIAVAATVEATRPLCCTCCKRCVVLQRGSGRPCLAGSSQSGALLCTTRWAGKTPGTPRTSMLFQPCEAIGEEPFAPQRYHFTSGVEIGGDLVRSIVACVNTSCYTMPGRSLPPK